MHNAHARTRAVRTHAHIGDTTCIPAACRLALRLGPLQSRQLSVDRGAHSARQSRQGRFVKAGPPGVGRVRVCVRAADDIQPIPRGDLRARALLIRRRRRRPRRSGMRRPARRPENDTAVEMCENPVAKRSLLLRRQRSL